MPTTLFLQNVIAIVWDFDKTLIPGYMQEPLFRRYGIDAKAFWEEVEGLPDYYRRQGLELVSPDSLYLNHILTYVRYGRFRGLSNAILREVGQELTFYPGIPEIFQVLRDRLAGHPGARQHDIRLEHYIISTGLRQTILGSVVAQYVDHVWGCEFVEAEPPPGYLSGATPTDPTGEICQVGYVLDNTTKTRAIFEINKGSNVFTKIDVNSFIAPEHRRVPFQNMIYVADGPSDVPVFSVVKGQGGRTYAVYPPRAEADFAQVNQLLREGRVHAFGEANFEPGSPTAIWLGQAVDEIAERITADRNSVLEAVVGKPPGHIS
jgi:hypothetical protein